MSERKSLFKKLAPLSGTGSSFEWIDSPLKVRSVLVDALATGAKVVVWLGQQEFVINSFFVFSNQARTPLLIELPKDFDQRKWDEALSKQESKECYVLAYLKKHAMVSFRANYIGLSGKAIAVELPDRLLQIQRRKTHRFEIPRGYEVYITIHGLSRRILDLSSGGCSFLVSPKEGSRFEKGTRFGQVLFGIRKRTIACAAIVKDRVETNGGIRVGVSFENLKEEDESFISIYIVESLIQYLGPYAV